MSYSEGLFASTQGSRAMNVLLLSFTVRLIDSMPPATTIGTRSTITRWAAAAIAFRPEPQARLITEPVEPTARPALIALWRATLPPVVPSGRPTPRITSSTSAGSTPARLTACAITWAPSVGPVVMLKAPRWALPIGVRAVETITASVMVTPCR